MLRITIELLPFGLELEKKLLGKIEVWNDASGTKNLGNYKFRIFEKGSEKTIWKTGDVKGFPRKRLTSYDLLYRCLKIVLGARNE